MRGDDVTSRLMVPEDAVGVGTLVQKEVGVACGLPIVEMVCRAYDERLRVEMIPGFHMEIIEGRFSDARQTPLLRLRGPMRSLLSAERVVLNFLQHLSGVATHTHRFVRRVAGTGGEDLRHAQDHPGPAPARQVRRPLRRGVQPPRRALRRPARQGQPPRRRCRRASWRTSCRRSSQQSRAEDPSRLVEVEVDRLEQLREVLKVDGIDVILLDNMDCPTMEQAVELRDRAGRKGQVELEASGGVTLETVRSIAATGVERIAVGAITHSAPALDIGLDVEVVDAADRVRAVTRLARDLARIQTLPVATVGADLPPGRAES